VTTDIYRICQIFVARFRIWGGLSNALGRLSLQKPPRGAGLRLILTAETVDFFCGWMSAVCLMQ